MSQSKTLWFHAPCFDGIASATLILEFFETSGRGSVQRLQPVGYGAREHWLETPLPSGSAVVDFLYHPDAEFWADHHQTSFLTPEAESHFNSRKGPYWTYDRTADSCAGLLWHHLQDAFEYRNARYADLVSWAERIDAARYSSVQEALDPTAPALQISAGLAYANDVDCVALVRQLRTHSLEEVASEPGVAARFRRVRSGIKEGLDLFERGAHLEVDNIVVFEVDARRSTISRYAPYKFFPDALYSVGILRLNEGLKVTAMRNPWRDFQGIPLGEVFEALGGGGHQRVGSVLLGHADSAQAHKALRHVLNKIREVNQKDSAQQCWHD